jgi:glycine betaine transporter
MKVLIAVDSMLYGKVLTDFVVNHLWAPGTQFSILHVVDAKRSDANFDQLWANANEIVEQVAGKVKEICHSAQVSPKVVLGNPEKEIIDMATNWASDLVILGSHTKSEIARLLLGSVSTAVSLKAPCSVVVLRLPVELPYSKLRAAESVVNS